MAASTRPAFAKYKHKNSKSAALERGQLVKIKTKTAQPTASVSSPKLAFSRRNTILVAAHAVIAEVRAPIKCPPDHDEQSTSLEP